MDQGIVLAVRAHGENGAIVSLLTENHGRHAGYMNGARSSKNRGMLEIGNVVDVNWQSRVSENLGTYKLELSRAHAVLFMSEPLKLAALQSACAICDAALPEREGHAGLYHGFLALLDVLDSEIWGAAYVMWEIALLREMGFSLDFAACAGGGSAEELAYMSPKTGKAVSLRKGEPYKDKLLILPEFLKPGGGAADEENVLLGLKLTQHFLEHWVFNHHTRGVPEARLVFGMRFGAVG